MVERKKAPIFKSPAGIAQYPRLTKPDTKFKADGEYKVTLILPGAEAQPLIEQIDAAIQASVVEAKRANPQKAKSIKPADAPYKQVVDEDGNETGDVKFNFKMAAKINSRKNPGESWTQRPDLFDAKGVPLVGVSIGGGSRIKVAFELFQFYTALIGAGVSLRLRAVQVLTLVEYSGAKDAKGYGFEEEEGYTATAGDAGDESPEADAGEEKVPDNEVEF